MSVTKSDWAKGISLSIIATIIGGASKLAIRKSWLMVVSSERGKEDDNMKKFQEETTDHVSDSSDCSPPEILSSQRQVVLEDTSKPCNTALLLRLSGMFGMTFLNPLCGVLAMNYASPSITAPFSGLTLVWIILFSNSFVGEKPSLMQIVASSLIVLGEVVVAIFGDHTNDNGVTLADLEKSYRNPPFLLFFLAIILWMLLIAYWILYSKSSTFKRFAWGVAGGCVTGIQNFLKDGLTILKAKEGLPWYSFLFLALSIAASFGGLLLLTACMKRYDATYSSAMFVGSYVVIVSIMSATHYNTFQNLAAVINYILYPFGLLILIVGVWILVIQTNELVYYRNTTINSGEENTDEGSNLKRDLLINRVCSMKQEYSEMP